MVQEIKIGPSIDKGEKKALNHDLQYHPFYYTSVVIKNSSRYEILIEFAIIHYIFYVD